MCIHFQRNQTESQKCRNSKPTWKWDVHVTVGGESRFIKLFLFASFQDFNKKHKLFPKLSRHPQDNYDPKSSSVLDSEPGIFFFRLTIQNWHEQGINHDNLKFLTLDWHATMAGLIDEDAPRGTHSILNWYDSTRPMFIDLVGDYAGKELFLVEGDSLLRECFEDERIDFQGKLPVHIYALKQSQYLLHYSSCALGPDGLQSFDGKHLRSDHQLTSWPRRRLIERVQSILMSLHPVLPYWDAHSAW